MLTHKDSLLDDSKASWQIDFSKNQVIRSSNHDAFFGYSENESEWNVEIFFRHIHPEDSEKFSQSIKKAMDSSKSFEHVFRVVWNDHSIHHLRSWGVLECDPQTGKPLRLIGFTEFAPSLPVISDESRNLF